MVQITEAQTSSPSRTQIYRRKILEAPYEICIERARYYTESYEETEGMHPAIRAAKALENTLQKMTLYIIPEEQIVGNRSSKLVATIIPIERGELNYVLKIDLKNLKNRKDHPYHISGEEEEELGKMFKYWKGKTVRDHRTKIMKERGLHFKISLGPGANWRRLRNFGLKNILKIMKIYAGGRLRYISSSLNEVSLNNPNLVMNVFDVQGHLVIGINTVIKTGFKGVKEKAREVKKAVRDSEKKSFLDAVMVCCDAAKMFAQRFATLAEEMAQRENDSTRKAELFRMAESCRWVPWNPPRSFYEACQFLWFTQVMASISYGVGLIGAVGRVDQYLYPQYKKDIEEGKITREQALELVEELLIKFSYNLLLLPSFGKHTASELGADEDALTIGGVGGDGEDATNELSYIWMDACKNMKNLTNTFSVRVSSKSSEEWLQKIAEVYSVTSGPALYNDDVTIPALINNGTGFGDARDYAVIGCVEPTSAGNTFGCTSGNDISLVGILEMVLTNGMIRMLGRRTGLDTGDPRKFTTFEQLMDAFKKQLQQSVDVISQLVEIKDEVYDKWFQNPYISATLEGCVENAMDMTSGGARYNFNSISGRGIGTTVDSLAALKKVVFEDKTATMGEVIDALETNFRGKKGERLRQILINKAPKYGNDDDYADLIAREIAETFCNMVMSKKAWRGGPYRASFFSYGLHVLDGNLLGATPNGRKAGEPTSNSLSPSNGMENNGPTAVLKSCSKIDHTKIANGCSLNIKMLPALLRDEERRQKLASLIRAYFKLGGSQVQFNIVDSQTLRDAQKNPEKYRDLVVRVSGYCAYFTDLGKPIQDDIIARAEFGSL
ncbi:MAG: pyruvate formate lyase family protein [Candidatus Freyarchaeum deiterrae]